MKTQLSFCLVALSGWLTLCSISLAAPVYPEPSEEEMRRAIDRAMVDRGGTRTKSGEISVDNPLNGVGLRITEFTKLGCEVAIQGPGYICSYHYMGKMSAHSNEGTRQGDNHAAGVNQLLKALRGGREEVGGSATRRFLKMGDEWTVSME